MTTIDLQAEPYAEYAFEDPVTGVRGWLVVDTLVDDLAFGGFRFHPGVTAQEVRDLARCMTWKLACHGLPTGGAKAGLALDPRREDCLGILERFVAAVKEPLLSHVMLGKDMGASDQLIDQVYTCLKVPQMHTTRRRRGERNIPERLRELQGYCTHMTGRGVAVAAHAATGGLEDVRVGIQGFGLVGAGSAYRLSQMGADIVALADVNRTVQGSDMPLAELIEKGRTTRTVCTSLLNGRGISLEPEAVLDAEVDLLVLAAGSHIVGPEQAERIRARIVVEGANFALTPDARRTLHERGIRVIPDLIASSSSAALVTRQMASGNALTAEDCWEAIDASISNATLDALSRASERGISVRQAYLETYAL